jgi:hypothetical protein
VRHPFGGAAVAIVAAELGRGDGQVGDIHSVRICYKRQWHL